MTGANDLEPPRRRVISCVRRGLRILELSGRYGPPLCLTRQCCNRPRWNTHSTPFFPRLAHENIARDSRASILFDATGDLARGCAPGLAGTVLGRIAAAAAGDRRRYLARHPQAAEYCDFADFSFWRLAPEQVHAVAGFGRIMTFPAGAVFDGAGAAIAAIEEEAIAHMNRDHADAVQLYAATLAGRGGGGDWPNHRPRCGRPGAGRLAPAASGSLSTGRCEMPRSCARRSRRWPDGPEPQVFVDPRGGIQ